MQGRYKQKRSYRKQIARQLRTQFAQGRYVKRRGEIDEFLKEF